VGIACSPSAKLSHAPPPAATTSASTTQGNVRDYGIEFLKSLRAGGGGRTLWTGSGGFASWDLTRSFVAGAKFLEVPRLWCLTCDNSGDFCASADKRKRVTVWELPTANRHSDIRVVMEPGETAAPCWGSEWDEAPTQGGIGLVFGSGGLVWTSERGFVRHDVPPYWPRSISPGRQYAGILNTKREVGELQIWTLGSEKRLFSISGSYQGRHSTTRWTWAPRSDDLMAVSDVDGIGVWSISRRRKLVHFKDHDVPHWSPDGKYLWMSGFSVAIGEVSSGKVVAEFKGRYDTARVAWHPERTLAASFGDDLVVWTPQGTKTLLRDGERIYEFLMSRLPKWSPDGEWLAVATGAWRVQDWKPSSWKEGVREDQEVFWAPNSKWVFVLPGKVVDVETGQTLYKAHARSAGLKVEAARWTENNDLLVWYEGKDRHVLRVEVLGKRERWFLLERLGERVQGVSYSPSGEFWGRKVAVQEAIRLFPESLNAGARVRPASNEK